MSFRVCHLLLMALVPEIISVKLEGRYYTPQSYEGARDSVARHNQPASYSDDGPRAPPPAILSHKQGITNEGVFNYVFAADNGLKQGESIAPDGTRTGAYEYIDPSGKTIFVKYTAGKDGFKILEGDHIPLQPQAYKPDPQYQPDEFKNKADDGKYRTESEDYNQQEQYKPQPKPQSQQYRQQDPQSQRYLQQKQFAPQTKLFQPSPKQQPQQQQQQAGSYGRQPEPKPMLYNVEQRHAVNYRKYTDNGQAAGSEYDGNPSAENAPHAYGSGYNFEFKG